MFPVPFSPRRLRRPGPAPPRERLRASGVHGPGGEGHHDDVQSPLNGGQGTITVVAAGLRNPAVRWVPSH